VKFEKGTKEQISAHFNTSEFDCKCKSVSCTYTQIDMNLVRLLEALRSNLGVSLKINSGYRCKTHNAAVGGASYSRHLRGEAADISSHIDRETVAQAAQNLFGGIGRYNTFTHLDVRQEKARWRKRS